MTTTRAAKAPAKERLSRDVVVTSALALADTEGLDAVTIRRLAADLGVTPMALYWHFQDKERLLDGIAERVLSQMDVETSGSGEWSDDVRTVLAGMLDQLRAHPATAELIHTRILLSEPGLQISERVLALLQGAGFDPEMAGQLAMHALTSVIGLVASQPGLYVGADDEEREQAIRSKKARLMELSPQRYPALLASSDGLLSCADSTYFDMGLDMFIAGVRALQPATH